MYLKHRMYVARNMVPITDPRKLAEKAVGYWNYRNRVCSPTERELWCIKQNLDGPSYDITCHREPSTCPGDSKRMWCDKKFDTPPSI